VGGREGGRKEGRKKTKYQAFALVITTCQQIVNNVIIVLFPNQTFP
jgi:hypothetical protein